MTIESTRIKRIYDGNGATTVFPVPFQYSETETLIPLYRDSEGNVEVLKENYRIDVTANGDTSLVYPLAGLPMPRGDRLTIYRSTPLIQIVDLINGGAFAPDVVEWDGFDRIVMMIQELKEALDRAVKVEIDSDMTAEELLEILLAAAAAADRAEDAANRAEDAADRAEAAVDLNDLAGLVQNIMRSWTAPSNLASGTVMTLPTGYFAGRNHMLLFYDGAFCQPYDRLGNGQYQYQEIGDINTDVLSYSVRLSFPVTAGKQFTMYVLASNAWRVSDEVMAALEGTRGNVEEAEAILAQVQAELAGIADDVASAAQSATSAASSAAASAQSASVAAASLAEFEELEATATTLAAGSAATAGFDPSTGLLTLGIPKGDQGAPGPQGEAARMVTVDALPTTGTAGDLYLLSTDAHLYGWDITSSTWVDLGAVTVSDVVDWASVTGKPTSFAPSAHAASHGASGPDAVTPAAIGALPASGTALAATKLATARSLWVADSLTGSVSFDGSSNAGIPISVSVPDFGKSRTLPDTTETSLRSWLAAARSNLSSLIYGVNADGVTADMNSLNIPGTYFIGYSASTLNNPYAITGNEHLAMYVYGYGDGSWVMQLATGRTSLQSAIRFKAGSNFSAWAPIGGSVAGGDMTILCSGYVDAANVMFSGSGLGNLTLLQTGRFSIAPASGQVVGVSAIPLLLTTRFISANVLTAANSVTISLFTNATPPVESSGSFYVTIFGTI